MRDRAIPWTRLIVRQGRVPQDLNTSRQSRASAIAAWSTIIALCLTPFIPAALWVAVLAVGMLVALNAEMYAFFLRKRGLLFAVLAVGMHGLYLLYSSPRAEKARAAELVRDEGLAVPTEAGTIS